MIFGRVCLGSFRNKKNWNNASKCVGRSNYHSGIPGFSFRLFCSQEQENRNIFRNTFLFRNIPNERALCIQPLRLLCTFRSIIFFKSGFLSQNIGRSVIFNLKKKLLKKTKFWRRNRSFTFSPEVKVYPLIDSPMMLCNQPRRLATQLISHHTSILLGVIILGMNKPRPWKCPWTSSKKRKKRTKNENTAMNEQAKVDGKLKLRLYGIKPAKDRVESFN